MSKAIKQVSFFTIILTVFFISCTSNKEINVDDNNLLIGNWSNASYDGEKTTFKRVSSLPDSDFGISFKNDDIFVMRTSGWCGTPPLTFYNANGEWTLSNKLIEVITEEFPGNFNWEIIQLNKEKLVVRRVLTEQEKDYRELMDLFEEIQALADSVKCTNDDDWKFTAYGSKPCGGPWGYIAYSKEINEELFLQKIEEYSNRENEYNIKWNIGSTCDVTPVPKSIECRNELPFLIY